MSVNAIDIQKIWEEQILPVKNEILKSLSWCFHPIQDTQYSDANLNVSVERVLEKNGGNIDEVTAMFKNFYWTLESKEQRLIATKLIRIENTGTSKKRRERYEERRIQKRSSEKDF